MRVGIAGLGSVAFGLHIPAVVSSAPHLILVGGADEEPSARQRFHQATGLRAYENAEHLMHAAAPDLLIVATPPSTHVENVVCGLNNAAHVLCEKPLALGVGQASALHAVAEANGLQLAVNVHFRYQPALRALAQRVSTGRAGRPLLTQATQLTTEPPENAASGWRRELRNRSMLEGGIHVFDYVLFLHGCAPVSVFAAQSDGRLGKDDTDAISVTSIVFRDGSLANVVINRRFAAGTRYLEVRTDTENECLELSIGGRAAVRVGKERGAKAGLHLEFAAGGIAYASKGLRRTVLGRNPRCASLVATKRLLEEVAANISFGVEVGCSARSVLPALTVIEAAYESARTGRTVKLGGNETALHGDAGSAEGVV